MSNEEKLLLNITPDETRVAWVENGVLQEVWIERTKKRGLVGNIYWAKIERVLPGMQAAFVDLGLDKAGFLHLSDVILPKDSARETAEIGKILYAGQKILVQVLKNPLGTKGARVTMQISLPSRLLVYMPSETTLGVSHRIEAEAERDRLRDLIQSVVTEQKLVGGVIVRTVAEKAEFIELRADLVYLQKLWQEIQQMTQTMLKPGLVYEDLPLYLQILRDIPNEGIEKIRADSLETYKKMLEFSQMYVMDISDKIGHYTGDRPIFDLYSIEDEIQTALEKRVELKSGGYLIIDQTEAMTTIDVNTGGFVGHKNLEETIYRTNLEATEAIARQLRLRNLGGIIILDLIDMVDEAHKQHVCESLDRHLAKDRVITTRSTISELGLIEMTRKRTRASLEQTLTEPCPTCNGRGVIKTAETVAYEIFREIIRMDKSYDDKSYRVIAGVGVVEQVLDEEADSLAELETFIQKPISFQAESSYPPEFFDVVIL